LSEDTAMPKILVVDDAKIMRAAIRRILEKNEFGIVDEADNGIEAVKKYITFKPDVVTMDITMPEMNGIEALRNIKEFDPDADVIMVSAMGQEILMKEAVLLGARSFIIKPFKEEQVIEALLKVLQRKL
jgi:two-component system chemotaxis response regulator CheY